MTIIRSAAPDIDQSFVIRLQGEIDMATATFLTEGIEGIAASPPPVIVLDFADVTFIDSSGLNALVQAQATATAIGSALVLRSLSDCVARTLELTRLDEHLTVESSPPQLAH